MEEKKKYHILIIILIVVLSIVITATYSSVSYQKLYGSRLEEYKNNYLLLEGNYSNLKNDYNDLQSQYSTLLDDYNRVSESLKLFEDISIDHLIQLTYNEIRENIQPQYNPWFGTYYYDQQSVEYASNVCAHDRSILFWPSIEDNYYDLKGSHLTHDAYSIIEKIIDYIDIKSSDSETVKIEKILNFITSNIEYQSDLNDEFLFPIETLVYRTGDCDDFSILAGTLLEEVGFECAIGFFTKDSQNTGHSMVLIKLNDIVGYNYWYFDDLTNMGLSDGKWIILEPQATIENQHSDDWFKDWKIKVASEIPNII